MSGLKVPGREILSQIGGLVSEDGCERRPRDVSNVIASLKRTADREQGLAATCPDKLLDYSLKLRASFEIFVMTSAVSCLSFRKAAANLHFLATTEQDLCEKLSNVQNLQTCT